MRKLLIVTALGLFLTGCGTLATESEFWQHDSVYKNWEHTWFSWTGYKTPTASDVASTRAQNWWGLSVPTGEDP
jgi:uncharacterized protein YceK